MTTMIVTKVAKHNFFISCENGCLSKYNISFLMTTKMESSVATCKNILTKSEFSSPNMLPKSNKCPLDEIGRNSVNPCKSPNKIN